MGASARILTHKPTQQRDWLKQFNFKHWHTALPKRINNMLITNAKSLKACKRSWGTDLQVISVPTTRHSKVSGTWRGHCAGPPRSKPPGRPVYPSIICSVHNLRRAVVARSWQNAVTTFPGGGFFPVLSKLHKLFIRGISRRGGASCVRPSRVVSFVYGYALRKWWHGKAGVSQRQ